MLHPEVRHFDPQMNRRSKSSFTKNGKRAMIGQSVRTEVAARLSRRSWGRNLNDEPRASAQEAMSVKDLERKCADVLPFMSLLSLFTAVRTSRVCTKTEIWAPLVAEIKTNQRPVHYLACILSSLFQWLASTSCTSSARSSVTKFPIWAMFSFNHVRHSWTFHGELHTMFAAFAAFR